MQAAYVSPNDYLMSRPASPDFAIWIPANNKVGTSASYFQQPCSDSVPLQHSENWVEPPQQSENWVQPSTADAAATHDQTESLTIDPKVFYREPLPQSYSLLDEFSTPGPCFSEERPCNASAESDRSVLEYIQATSNSGQQAISHDRGVLGTYPSLVNHEAESIIMNTRPEGLPTHANTEDALSTLYDCGPSIGANEEQSSTKTTKCNACGGSIPEMKPSLHQIRWFQGPRKLRHLFRWCHPNWECWSTCMEDICNDPSIQTELSHLPGIDPSSFRQKRRRRIPKSQKQGSQFMSAKDRGIASEKKRYLISSHVYCPCADCGESVFWLKETKHKHGKRRVRQPTPAESMRCMRCASEMEEA